MANPCAPGTSQPIPGSGAITVMTGAAVESVLILLGLEPVAAVLGPILAGETYDLTQLCPNGPPGDPGLTGQDVLDVIDFADPLVSVPALKKCKQWFENLYWYVACQCVGSIMPTAPAPSNPGNPTGTNTGLPDGHAAGPCWDVQRSVTTSLAGSYTSDSRLMLPAIALHPVTSIFTNATAQVETIPAGVSNITITFSSTTTPIPALSNASIAFYNASGTNVGGFSAQLHSTDTGPISNTLATVPAGTVYWEFAYELASVGTYTFNFEVAFNCSGAGPTTLTTPCCPPDQLLEQKLNQILGLVTLIQRQNAPFAYVLGATHSALSGIGHFAVQGLLGIKVLPAAIPPGAGVDIGDPDTLWLDSWINWGNPDGWTSREFLRSSPFVSLPAAAGQFTLIGYSLRPGLTVDIVELVREP